MSFPLPKPKLVTADEVVLSRGDWEQIVAALASAEEDANDIAAVTEAREEDARFAARIESERGRRVETTVPIEVVKAKLEGVHPVRAWRDHKGWTQLHLAFKSGVGRDL